MALLRAARGLPAPPCQMAKTLVVLHARQGALQAAAAIFTTSAPLEPRVPRGEVSPGQLDGAA